MRTEFLNGRRCASVERFIELDHQSFPYVLREEEEDEGEEPILFTPRDSNPESVFLPAATFKSDVPQQSTVFGTFTKQPSANSHRPLSNGRGVQQKMRSNGFIPNPTSGYVQQQPGSHRPSTSSGMPKQEAVYRPESLVSSAPTQKTYEKLAEVYSTSNDTAQFAGNLRKFISERIPYGVWVAFGTFEIIVGLALLFIGALNIPMCEIQPFIPIYEMAAGIVLITHGIVRIFASIPTPPVSSRRQRSITSKLRRDLCTYAIEGIVLLFMIIVTILGCVWVYGSRYVHFHEGLFEEDYCNGFIYWSAWWSVTLHLAVLSLFILGFLIIIIYGSVVSDQ